MEKGRAIVISSENGRVFKKMDRARAPFKMLRRRARHGSTNSIKVSE